MRSFFKIFFAALLALFVFALIGFFLMVGALSGLAAKEKPEVAAKSILLLDLSRAYPEQKNVNPIDQLTSSDNPVPGLYDVVRMIRHAKKR